MKLLWGRAWAEAINANQPVATLSLEEFVAKLKVFAHPDHCGDASKCLSNLFQGTSVADHSPAFRMLVADAGWNDLAL